MTWQQIFEDALQVTVVGGLSLVPRLVNFRLT